MTKKQETEVLVIDDNGDIDDDVNDNGYALAPAVEETANTQLTSRNSKKDETSTNGVQSLLEASE